jgi:phage replication-related protein YjqB (UPF0714/DUF867 family)
VGLLSDLAAAATGLTIEQNMGNSLLRNEAERCALSGDVFRAQDVALGEQVRLRCSEADYESGLYTVVDDSRQRESAEMSKDGLNRIGITKGDTGSIRTYGPHPDYSTRTDAAEHDEYVEILQDDGDQSALVACAPHGGWIEYRTDRQAARVADTLSVTEWICAGYNSGGGAYDRWHITSTAIDRRSFPKLDSIADRGFNHAVSFHGFSQDGIAIGGGAPDSILQAIRDAVDAATNGAYDVYLADDDGSYSGSSPENFVNWLTAEDNGVQIEQSWDARVDDWEAIADAVGTVYADIL